MREFRVGQPVICQLPNRVELVGAIMERADDSSPDHALVFFGPLATQDPMPGADEGIEPTAAIVPRQWLRPFVGELQTPKAIHAAIGL